MSFTAALAQRNPASLGSGDVPELKGLPPPPTGKGKIDTGGDAQTKQGAGGALIAAARDYKGYAPEMADELDALIEKVKKGSVPKGGNEGPPNGEPGIPGSAQLDSSPLMDSGGAGAF